MMQELGSVKTQTIVYQQTTFICLPHPRTHVYAFCLGGVGTDPLQKLGFRVTEYISRSEPSDVGMEAALAPDGSLRLIIGAFRANQGRR